MSIILASVMLIVNFLASTVYGREIPDSMALLSKGLHQECVAETKVGEDLIALASSGEFSSQPEFKCYLKCLLKKVNMISNAGVIDYKGLISISPPDYKETAAKMVNDCHEITGTDSCDKAWNFNVCLYNSNPAEYFTI